MADFSLDTFEFNLRTLYALTRCLEIVSEASRSLTRELRDKYPDLPWRAIMESGNIYRHNYDNVVEEFVWRTVHKSLAPLLAMAETELAGFSHLR